MLKLFLSVVPSLLNRVLEPGSMKECPDIAHPFKPKPDSFDDLSIDLATIRLLERRQRIGFCNAGMPVALLPTCAKDGSAADGWLYVA